MKDLSTLCEHPQANAILQIECYIDELRLFFSKKKIIEKQKQAYTVYNDAQISSKY